MTLRALMILVLTLPSTVNADSAFSSQVLMDSWAGYLSIAIFLIAYAFVILEEKLHLRKSKPIMLAASLIWIIIAIAYQQNGESHNIESAIRHNFLEYAELFFFLLVGMTYINAMLERGVFEALKSWLVVKGYSYKILFWLTGILAFCISPIADNLTTALIMCAVILSVGEGKPEFISISCINIVIASNAGGAFSPFGDITTLMVWQKGIIEFEEFFTLFIPSLINFLVPALIMQTALPSGAPSFKENSIKNLKVGGLPILGLFVSTIITAVIFHNFFHIPPVFGMMMGLSYLKLYGFYLRSKSKAGAQTPDNPPIIKDDSYDFDVFEKVAHAEWDTLFFFYGVILAVGGLGHIGYLGAASELIYGQLDPTVSNIIIGVLSSIVDNIPVMFSVLTMNPDMPHSQWLLVTLTAGVGGSLLSIGSAAGVALMGQARGQYTFMKHLKWTPVIALGYIASITTHLLINA